MTVSRFMLAGNFVLLILIRAHADTIGEWPDTPTSRWFKSLQRPDIIPDHPENADKLTASCCGVADVVDTMFKVEHVEDYAHPQDTWFAWLKGKWVRIPPEKIVPDYAPDGKPYLFVFNHMPLADPVHTVEYEIACFVRPLGGI